MSVSQSVSQSTRKQEKAQEFHKCSFLHLDYDDGYNNNKLVS